MADQLTDEEKNGYVLYTIITDEINDHMVRCRDAKALQADVMAAFKGVATNMDKQFPQFTRMLIEYLSDG